jgi:hypothetical protein
MKRAFESDRCADGESGEYPHQNDDFLLSHASPPPPLLLICKSSAGSMPAQSLPRKLSTHPVLRRGTTSIEFRPRLSRGANQPVSRCGVSQAWRGAEAGWSSRRATRSRPAFSLRTIPLLMVSRPAIMRSNVDLPQPEGPTRTTNSPSSALALTHAGPPAPRRTCARCKS